MDLLPIWAFWLGFALLLFAAEIVTTGFFLFPFGIGAALAAVLNLAGVKPDRKEVRRAVEFLVRTQNADGSWPMTPRSHPDTTPAKNPAPITYFGSAWATIGLARSVDR